MLLDTRIFDHARIQDASSVVAGKLHQVPFVLKGPFGEADTEAIDAEPDSELATDVMGIDVEVDAEGAAATADGGMIVDDDEAVKNIGTPRVLSNLPPS